MPRHIEPPKTIAERGGLAVYLDETRGQHNGLDYQAFLSRIDPDRKHPLSKPQIAEDFNVSPRTIYSWIRIYRTEQRTK